MLKVGEEYFHGHSSLTGITRYRKKVFYKGDSRTVYRLISEVLRVHDLEGRPLSNFTTATFNGQRLRVISPYDRVARFVDKNINVKRLTEPGGITDNEELAKEDGWKPGWLKIKIDKNEHYTFTLEVDKRRKS